MSEEVNSKLTLCDDTWVETLGEESLALLEELCDEKNITGGSVSCDIVLCGGSSGDESGRWVLNLLKGVPSDMELKNESPLPFRAGGRFHPL